MKRVPCEQCSAHPTCLTADLPLEGLEEFRACSLVGIYRRRQIIFHEDAESDGLYLLCQGAVKLYQSDRFGRDHIVAVAGPGEVLNELSLEPGERHSLSAEALADSHICYLSRERLLRFIERHPQAGVRLVGALSRSLAATRRKLRELALKRAEGRLAELLIQLAQAAAEPPDSDGHRRLVLAYSRREIAEMIGVSTETAIRLLGKLKRKQVIATDHRELIVTDPERLARIANHDGPP